MFVSQADLGRPGQTVRAQKVTALEMNINVYETKRSVLETNITELKMFQGLGATSLLILVGVAIDTAKQIQTYLISEKYNIMIQ